MLGHFFNLSTQLDFFREKDIPGAAIFLAFVRKTNSVDLREFEAGFSVLIERPLATLSTYCKTHASTNDKAGFPPAFTI